MNTNELMIGDWVMIKDYPMRSMPKKVREEHFVRSLVEFEPISLTEDILNANDIEWEFYDCYHFHFNHKGVDLHLSGFFHVHELQHALRLCGLNELADNFKIK